MAKGWLKALQTSPSLRDSVTIVGLVDLDRANADNLAAEFDLGGVETGSDLAAVLAATRPDILLDIVVPGARRDVVATGLADGTLRKFRTR